MALQDDVNNIKSLVDFLILRRLPYNRIGSAEAAPFNVAEPWNVSGDNTFDVEPLGHYVINGDNGTVWYRVGSNASLQASWEEFGAGGSGGGGGSVGDWQNSVIGVIRNNTDPNDLDNTIGESDNLDVWDNINFTGSISTTVAVSDGDRFLYIGNAGISLTGAIKEITDATDGTDQNGTIPVGAIIEFFDASVRNVGSSVDGWIIKTPEAGIFTTIDQDSNDTFIFYNGSTWNEKTAETVIPNEVRYTAIDTYIGNTINWQIASSSHLTELPVIDEFEVDVNNVNEDDVQTSGNPSVSWGFVTDDAQFTNLTPVSTTQFTSDLNYDITANTPIIRTFDGTSDQWGNIINYEDLGGGTYRYTIDRAMNDPIQDAYFQGIVTAATYADAYASASNNHNLVWLLWHNGNAGYHLEDDDEIRVTYWKLKV